jgi:hypothetical protein
MEKEYCIKVVHQIAEDIDSVKGCPASQRYKHAPNYTQWAYASAVLGQVEAADMLANWHKGMEREE